MADVFISYARDNQAVAQHIADAVRAAGYSVWWDDDLPPHLSYGEVISDQIGSARAAIVVWSREAAASEWVRAEADLARNHRKLIQTSIDDTPPPMPFNQIQYASLAGWDGAEDHPGWRKVRTSLAALCGGEAPAPTATAFPSAPPPAAPGATATRLTTDPAPPAPSAKPPRAAPGWGGSSWIALFAVVAAFLVAGALALAWLWAGDGDPGKGGPSDEFVGPATAVAPAAAPGSANPTSAATARFDRAAMIDDPDGYTNVRSGPASTFPVVARVERDEVFTTYVQDRDWWQVRTATSRVGFMERSRIRLLEPGAGSPPAAAAVDPGFEAGAVPAADTAAAGPGPGMIFPDSDRRLITPEEIASLSARQRRLARNEIFARHGRPFLDPNLRRYFQRFSWYRPRPGPIALNRVEQANVRRLEAGGPGAP